MTITTSSPLSAPPAKLDVPTEWDLAALKLEGNEGGPIPPTSLAWLSPIPISDPEGIRNAYERDGVVLVRGVLDPAKVLATREEFFNFVKPSGVLMAGTAPVEGIFVGGDPSRFAGPGIARVPKGAHLASDAGKAEVASMVASTPYFRLSIEAGRAEFINEFARDPAILDAVRLVKPQWEEPILFRRQLLRSNIPGAERAATKVHYDQIFLRAAPPTSITAWIPIGDVGPASGGLLYLEDSVPLGLEIEDGFAKAAEHLTAAERLSAFNQNMMAGGTLSPDPVAFATTSRRRWLVGDYRAGDIVFHHPCLIHCSANNHDAERRIRLATDLRFADKKGEYDHRWAENYYSPDDGL